MDLGIDGDAALVTASASGLGLASARSLAREGADVAICGRDDERLSAARDELEAVADGDVLATRVDLTDPDDVAAAVESTVDAFDGLDHLVTAAGAPARAPFLETTEREWYEAYDLLVMSVVWTIERAHPHLLESTDGSIVCLAPPTAGGDDERALSSVIRPAVGALVRTAAREFAPEIRVNAVSSGAIETERVGRRLDGAGADDEAARERLAADVPLGRVGDPAEVGAVVAVLSSPRASYVTGAEVAVDGGLGRP